MGKSGMSFSRFKHRIFLPFNALSFIIEYLKLLRDLETIFRAMCSSATDISLSSSFFCIFYKTGFNTIVHHFS